MTEQTHALITARQNRSTINEIARNVANNILRAVENDDPAKLEKLIKDAMFLSSQLTQSNDRACVEKNMGFAFGNVLVHAIEKQKPVMIEHIIRIAANVNAFHFIVSFAKFLPYAFLIAQCVKPKDLYSVAEVAQIFKMPPRSIRKNFDEGRLTGFKIPGSPTRKITLESLFHFADRNKIPLNGLERCVNGLYQHIATCIRASQNKIIVAKLAEFEKPCPSGDFDMARAIYSLNANQGR